MLRAPSRAPLAPSLLAPSILAVAVMALASACPKPAPVSEQPDAAPAEVDRGPELDLLGLCQSGCDRLTRCVPELASASDEQPTTIATRLVQTCAPACERFADVEAAAAVRDCLGLDACGAYWGCVSSEAARPWLASVAPVGDRSCENLCSQASACAINTVCEAEAEAEARTEAKTGPGGAAEGSSSRRSSRGAKARDGASASAGASEAAPGVDSAASSEPCITDEARRSELEEHCLLECQGTPEDSLARAELIGCIDHGSCGGLLTCLDSWASTDYGDDSGGPLPGVHPACDAFCTRAIVCGAEQDAEGEALSPEDIAELERAMTSAHVECAVQCGKDIDAGQDAAGFSTCAAAQTCEDFGACAETL
ncbi:hypothetical protein G6O69_22120 [Pseudenhygromyxa sp. WMMC2535]|uniref:hypothetical protein n=1 Tax=Pseudenhygromyxa sp. WMMC2535 TaxID=2712867 RepID=UPI0015564685|nr:hypothetical protein [Pseudenhygromyxa sp. WMMC2535]NVB40554.1 hypothetical protein [Pseudenhygromyxa sp. WMMC2535]